MHKSISVTTRSCGANGLSVGNEITFLLSEDHEELLATRLVTKTNWFTTWVQHFSSEHEYIRLQF